MLGISRSSIYRLFAAGKLTRIRIAGRSLVEVRELRVLVAEAAGYVIPADAVPHGLGMEVGRPVGH